MENYTKHELRGKKVHKLLNTFSNLFVVAGHYTYKHMLCMVATVDSTMYNLKKTEHTISCCYFLLMAVPM